jgi:hypothetical protein
MDVNVEEASVFLVAKMARAVSHLHVIATAGPLFFAENPRRGDVVEDPCVLQGQSQNIKYEIAPLRGIFDFAKNAPLDL